MIIILLITYSACVASQRTPTAQLVSSGSRVDFISPCSNKHGVFSKKNGRESACSEPIWINGTFEKKDDRFSYANGVVSIRDTTIQDTGFYVWKCYGNSGWSTSMFQLGVRNSLVKTSHRVGIVGYDVDLYRPCLTDSGFFSKRDDPEPIWRNGVVATNKSYKFVYDNSIGMLYLKSCVLEDAGEYIWTCDKPYWESKVFLTTQRLLTNVDQPDVTPRSVHQPETVPLQVHQPETPRPVHQPETVPRQVHHNSWVMITCDVSIGRLAILAILIYVCYSKCRQSKRGSKAPNIESKNASVGLYIDELPPTYRDVISE